MPAGAAVQPEHEEEEEAERQRAARKLAISAGLMMTAVTMVVPTRAPMVLAIKKGDAAATAKAMGLMSTCAGLIELFLNPIIAKLSDQYGRKPFMTIAPLVNAFLHMLVAARPNALPMQFVDRMISGSMIFGFLAPQGAAMADVFAKTPEKLAVAAATAGMFFGVGTTIGPFIGSKLGGAKSFFASSMAFLAVAAFVQLGMNETLPKDSRKEFKLSSVNPLAFLALFKDKTLAMLAGVAMFQSFGDYVNIYDINNLYMIKVLGFQPAQIGNVAMTVGLSQIAGGAATSKLVKRIGLKSHVLFANLAWALGCAVLGTARTTPKLLAAIAIWTFGHQRANSVNVQLQTYGNAAGMGRGEIIAASGNLLAYVKIFVPLFYSNVFAWATSNGRNMPGLPYFIIAFLTGMSQIGYAIANPKE